MIAPDLRSIVRPIDGVHEDPRNARTHDDRNIAAIAESLSTFGQRKPIIALPDGTVIAGNGTLRAAKMLGWSEIAVATFEDEGKARAYALADNRTAELAKWDETVLAQTLEEMGEELRGSVGFSGGEVDRLLATLHPDADEAAPPPPATPVSKPGDLWILGRHRLICGDSTDPQSVARSIDGSHPLLMVTDPPYGVNYDPSWRIEAGVASAGAARGKVANDDRADWTPAWKLFPGDVVYVWHGALHSLTVAESLRRVGFAIRAQIVWVKARAALSRGHYHWQHEPAFVGVKDGRDDGWRFEEEHESSSYAVRDGGQAKWSGGRKQSTVWSISHVKNETGHGTQKPIECMARPMRNHGARGDHVYDPFLGSGTSIIAAEREGRICHGLELDPGYCDVIVERWQTATGGKATRG